MKRETLISAHALACVLLLAACAKTDKTAAKEDNSPIKAPPQVEVEKKTAAKVVASDATTKESPSKPVVAVETPESQQCDRILEKSWTQVAAVLAKLNVADVDALAEPYKKNGKTYLERCAKLSQEKRDCLEKANNPIAGIDSCKANEGLKAATKIRPVDMSSYVKLFEPAPVAAEDANEMLAKLDGTWVRDWKSAKLHTTWKIDKAGKVESKTIKFDKPQPDDTIQLGFTKERRIDIKKGTSSQSFSFFQGAKRTFYTSSNLLYDAYPITDKKSFVIRNDWDYVVFDNDSCEAINTYGNVTKGECSFGKEGKQKVFKVKYTYPGKVLKDGTPVIKERTYIIIGDHFLHEDLVGSGKFSKK